MTNAQVALMAAAVSTDESAPPAYVKARAVEYLRWLNNDAKRIR